jgi:hypothetical protein
MVNGGVLHRYGLGHFVTLRADGPTVFVHVRPGHKLQLTEAQNLMSAWGACGEASQPYYATLRGTRIEITRRALALFLESPSTLTRIPMAAVTLTA